MPPKVPVKLVDGLELLNPKSLPTSFSRFERDSLYFISGCQYNRSTEPYPRTNFVPRCVALTPTAFFVTDTSGNMDRATRFEYIAGGVLQIRMVTKFFGKQEEYHYIIKSTKEPDIHFFLTKENNWKDGKDNSMAKSFLTIMMAILDDKKGPGHGVTIREIPAEQDLAELINISKPAGYMSPNDIMLLNKQRKEIVTHVQETNKELMALRKEISEVKPEVIEKRAELKELESATSEDDLSGLRSELKKLNSKINKLTGTTTDRGMEIGNLNRESVRYQDQLAEEQRNYSDLVNSRVSKADENITKEQNDMMLLRQKAQRRELDKMHLVLNDTLQKLNAQKPVYSGHEGFAAKAADLEAKVEAALIAWTKEMDASNKMEKFLDHMNTDVDKINRHLQEKHGKKMKLIEEIEGKKPEEEQEEMIAKKNTQPTSSKKDELILDDSPIMAPDPAPASGGIDLDDEIDLSADSPKIVPATVAAGEDSPGGIDLDDDDLIGGGVTPTAATVVNNDAIDLDDDI